MKDLRIFVASSREFMPERNALAYFALKHEEEFEKRGFRVRLSKWEYVDPCVTATHTEERYLDEMRKSDAALILFREKLGKYTQMEYEEAVWTEEAVRMGKNETARLKAHRILFKEGSDIVPGAELAEWRATLPEGAYGAFGDRSGLEREFLELVERVSAEKLVELSERPGLRTVAVFFAADDELAGERDALADLALDLNERMGQYGARVEMRFYAPERHQELLETSEMAMAVYYTRIGAFGREQLEDAYGRATQGKNPRRLYVSFRSTEGKKLAADFRAFQSSFEEERGYFVGWFEHVDSLKNDFLLSLVNLLGERAALDDVRLEGAWVTFGGLRVADMSRLPVVAKNRGLNELKVYEADLEIRLVACREACERNPSDEALAVKFREVAAERLKVKEQIERELKLSLDLAKRMASFVVGEADEVLQKAGVKLEGGQINEARRILDAASMLHAEACEQIVRNADIRAEEIAQDVRKLRAGIEVDMFRADVILADAGRSFKDRFGEVERVHRTWVERLEKFGRICSRENGEVVDALLAEILHGLSYLYAANGREKDALPWAGKALAIRRLLAKADPQKHAGNLARTLHNFALLHYGMRRFDEAEVEYGEALEIYRQLAGLDPKGFEEYVATALNNFANLHTDMNRLVEAEDEYGEALEFYRRLARANRTKFEEYVAATLNNLAVLHAGQDRLEEAVGEYGEALEIRRWLAEASPEKYEEYVATTLNNLANLYVTLNRMEMAIEAYSEALKVYRRLAGTNLEKHEAKVAGTLNNIANLHTELNRFDAAEREYGEALEICRRLAKVNPGKYEEDVATTLNNLGALHVGMNQQDPAEGEYVEALVICRRLARLTPERYESNVAMTLNNLATLHKNQKRFEDAEREYGEALEIYLRLTRTSIGKYEGDLAGTLNNFASLNNDLERFRAAEEKYDKALEIYRRLAGANPLKYDKYVAQTLCGLVIVHIRLGQAGKGKAAANEALIIYRRLAMGNESVYREKIEACEKLLEELRRNARQSGHVARTLRIVGFLFRVPIGVLILLWRGIRFVVRRFGATKRVCGKEKC